LVPANAAVSEVIELDRPRPIEHYPFSLFNKERPLADWAVSGRKIDLRPPHA
jgi:hypothetical protein